MPLNKRKVRVGKVIPGYTTLVATLLPVRDVAGIDELVFQGLATSRSELIRRYVREGLDREHQRKDPVDVPVA